MAPCSICGLVTPQGRSPHCGAATDGTSQGQDRPADWEASFTRILKSKVRPEFTKGQFVPRTLKSQVPRMKGWLTW